MSITPSGLPPINFNNVLQSGEEYASSLINSANAVNGNGYEYDINQVSPGTIISSTHANELRAAIQETRAHMLLPGDIPVDSFNLPYYYATYTERNPSLSIYLIRKEIPVYEKPLPNEFGPNAKIQISYYMYGTCTNSAQNVYELDVFVVPWKCAVVDTENSNLTLREFIMYRTSIAGVTDLNYKYTMTEVLYSLPLIHISDNSNFGFSYDSTISGGLPNWNETNNPTVNTENAMFTRISRIGLEYWGYRGLAIYGQTYIPLWGPIRPYLHTDQPEVHGRYGGNSPANLFRSNTDIEVYNMIRPPLAHPIVANNNTTSMGLQFTLGFDRFHAHTYFNMPDITDIITPNHSSIYYNQLVLKSPTSGYGCGFAHMVRIRATCHRSENYS